LGDVANQTLQLNGGALRTTASSTFEHKINLDVAGGTLDSFGNNVVWNGLISGSGNLTKTGSGIVTLNAANTYTGTTSITGGTLAINQTNNISSGQISIANAALKLNSSVSLNNQIAVTGNATINTDANAVVLAKQVVGTGSLIKDGTGSLELAVANSYSGGTTLKLGKLILGHKDSLGSGQLTVESGEVQLKQGFIGTNLVQDTANKSTVITGEGAFSKTTVNNGTLLVDGILTTPITVGANGKLGGSGTIIGNITVNGTLSPGNSPAILDVQGNVTQGASSTLEVDIDGVTAGDGAGHYDQLNITGNYVIESGATLVAKLRNITGSATNTFMPVLGQSFEVVKANSVNGIFAKYQQLEGTKDGLSADTVLRVGYTTNSVLLYVTPKSYSSIATGENRQGAGLFLDDILKAVDKDPTLLAGSTDVAKFYRALVPANTAALNTALLNMSPAVYAESAESILALQQYLHSTDTEAFAKGGLALKALYKESDVDSDGNGVAATRNVSGIQLALDSEPYQNGVQIGARLSVVNQADLEANNANLNASGQDIAISIRKKLGDWVFAGSADMASYTFNSKRNIVVGNDVFKTYQDDLKARTRGLALTANSQMANWTISGGVRYNAITQDAFTEAGNSLLRLTVDKLDQDQVVAMAGGSWSKTWKNAMWDVVPKFGAHLEQTIAGDTAQVKASLAGRQVTSTASEVGKTLLRANVGVDFVNKDGITIGVDVTTEQADNLSANAGRLTFSKSF